VIKVKMIKISSIKRKKYKKTMFSKTKKENYNFATTTIPLQLTKFTIIQFLHKNTFSF
jgi:hypothetical protein